MKIDINKIVWKLHYIFVDVPMNWIDRKRTFHKNKKLFKKVLEEYQPYDYMYNVDILIRSLELTRDYIELEGHMTDEYKTKKIEGISKFIDLLYGLDEVYYGHFDQKKHITKMYRCLADPEKGLLTWWD